MSPTRRKNATPSSRHGALAAAAAALLLSTTAATSSSRIVAATSADEAGPRGALVPPSTSTPVAPNRSPAHFSIADPPAPSPRSDTADDLLLSEGQRGDRLALSEVPVVDIGPLLASGETPTADGGGGGDDDGLATVARDIRYALSNIGFMYVTNHGVPPDLIDRAFDSSRRFFDLPVETKRELSIDTSGEALHGWTDFFGENTDPERTRDYKEVFDLGRNASDNVIRPFFGPTPWPAEGGGEEVGNVVPDFQSVMTSYHDEMLSLARRIMRGLALSLDLPGNYFDEYMTEPIGIQRLLHYPSQGMEVAESDGGGEGEDEVEGERWREDEDDDDDDDDDDDHDDSRQTVGIGAHTDYGCIAILAQDDVGGLQVMNRDGRWIDAPPIPGTFVINIGDMIQRLTNDEYVANLHRVVNRSGRERYSIPFFFDVDYDTMFEPLGRFVSADRPARYPPTKCGEHKWERYRVSYPHLNGVAPEWK